MKKYFVTIHYTDTVEAESADEAVNAVFEDLDSQSNMSLTNTLCQFHTTVTPVDSGPVKKVLDTQDILKRLEQMLEVGGIEENYAREEITRLMQDINK